MLKKIACIFLALILAAALTMPITAQDQDRDVEAERLVYDNSWDKGVVVVLYQSRQYGTGWWVNLDDKILVTAAHVVNFDSSADQNDITIIRGTWTTKGKVVYLDRYSDICVIQADQVPEGAFEFSIAMDVRKGDRIIVIGYPYELLQVYANNIYRMSENPRASFGVVTWIETPYRLAEIGTYTDAGNSGGPIVNEKGAVVGLVTFALTGRSATLYFMTTCHAIREILDRAGVHYSIAPEFLEVGSSFPSSNPKLNLIILGLGAFIVGIMVTMFVVKNRRR